MKETLMILVALLAVGGGIAALSSTSPVAPRAPQLFDLDLAGYTTPAATSLFASMRGERSITYDPPQTKEYYKNTIWYSLARDGEEQYLVIEGRQLSPIVNREIGRKVVRIEPITDSVQKRELIELFSVNAPGHDVRFRAAQ